MHGAPIRRFEDEEGVDNGDVGPGVFTLTLSDGYSISGSLASGAIVIRYRRFHSDVVNGADGGNG
jgi:hypothetical protein